MDKHRDTQGEMTKVTVAFRDLPKAPFILVPSHIPSLLLKFAVLPLQDLWNEAPTRNLTHVTTIQHTAHRPLKWKLAGQKTQNFWILRYFQSD